MMEEAVEAAELEELRRLLPAPPQRNLSSERLARGKERLMQQMTRSTTPEDAAGARRFGGRGPERRRRIRNRILVFALIPAALIGGAVAYSVSANRSAEQLGNYVECFQAPRLDAPAAGAPLGGPDLAALCDFQWS